MSGFIILSDGKKILIEIINITKQDNRATVHGICNEIGIIDLMSVRNNPVRFFSEEIKLINASIRNINSRSVSFDGDISI